MQESNILLGVKFCPHCGIKSSTATEDHVFCHCEEMIKRYGASSCAGCKQYYRHFKSVHDYYADWLELLGSEEKAAHHTSWNYFEKFSDVMHKPCPCCHPDYAAKYNSLLQEFNNWQGQDEDDESCDDRHDYDRDDDRY